MNIYDFDECVLLDNKNKNTVNIQPTELCIDRFGVGGATEIEIRGTLRDYDWKPSRQRIDYSKLYGAMFWQMPKIKDVKFNDPATIVFWADGTKTVVKCQDDDIFDPEKGLAMAITKKSLGNKGNYCNELKKWLPKDKEETTIVVRSGQSTAEAIAKAINRMTSAMKEVDKRK